MAATPDSGNASPATLRWRREYGMVFRAFLAQNVAVGCAFGAFGVTVLPLQEKFGASRGGATLALALCVLMMGAASPVAGTLIGRIGLRWLMTIGTLLSAAGYALLAVTPGMTAVLLLYALPIGVGLAMFGPFPSSVLASNWFPSNPGPALGVANVPLFVALLPVIGSVLIRDHGLTALYLMLAVLHLLALPFMLTIADGPVDQHHPSVHDHAAHGMLPTGAVLGRPAFWVMCLGAGYINAAGITGVSHLAAFAAEKGVAANHAALLLSIMGGAAMLGALATGLLCGRLGAARTLALIAIVVCLSWLILSTTLNFIFMAIAALLMGAGGAGVFPAVNMLAGRLFGQASLPRVMGLFGLFTLPLIFCLPPLAGVLHDAVGGYGPVVGIIIGGTAMVALMFMTMGRRTVPADATQPVPVG
ncbi:CynX/NimT family MFS transporter [Sphingobium sp. EM0848]|uniref:MFS transporter n=1 Tax=Sphingobium sp. EM0848 TaxID=2743473 RepID=UPI002100B827|nr:MFS transporter [Sphingobium sp. EM0848]